MISKAVFNYNLVVIVLNIGDKVFYELPVVIKACWCLHGDGEQRFAVCQHMQFNS